VKLRHIPTSWDEKRLSQKLEKYFPGKLISVRIAYDLVELSELRKDWQNASIKLEQLKWEEENKNKVRHVRVCEDHSKDSGYIRRKPLLLPSSFLSFFLPSSLTSTSRKR
jgi:hypothetical protein